MCATRQLEIADDLLRLDVLYDESSDPTYDLPLGLWRRYGGDLRLDGAGMYANFVSSMDGVVALPIKHSPSVISRRSEADRFVMGLLRSCADAVLIGGGTMRADPGHAWTGEYIYPAAADDFRELRRSHGRSEHPTLVVLTASGDVDLSDPVLDGAVVVTTPDGQAKLGRDVPRSTLVRALDPITPERVLHLLQDEGLEVILSEAGPSFFGQVVASGCLRELFLTVSPLLVGSGETGRKTLSDDMALSPGLLQEATLVSVRRHEDHLFMRYRVR